MKDTRRIICMARVRKHGHTYIFRYTPDRTKEAAREAFKLYCTGTITRDECGQLGLAMYRIAGQPAPAPPPATS